MNFRDFLDSLPASKSPADRFRDRYLSALWQEYASPRSAQEYRAQNGGSDANPLWCGHFAAICAREAGINLDIAREILPSTYRLASDDYADSFYEKIGKPPLKRIAISDIKPGHICAIETSRPYKYGSHVVSPVKILSDGRILCIEGNARGLKSDGTHGHGVVLQVRNRADFRRAYEITSEHLR